jgi:K+-transporting ATPase ATPase C chain
MLKLILRSLIATVTLAILVCGVYPLVVTGVGKIFFSEKMNGGMVVSKSGTPVGAHLIGQSFSKPEYFHGRPSSAGNGYDAANSSGSNLGPTSQKWVDGIKTNISALLKENPQMKMGSIPVDLVTGSGSGLDPHISPEGALAQVARIAEARRISPETIKKLVDEKTEGPQLGLFGEPVVNVLQLNLALDQGNQK